MWGRGTQLYGDVATMLLKYKGNKRVFMGRKVVEIAMGPHCPGEVGGD